MKKQLTKQELKDRKEKKQRILKFVLRSINIVCYVLSVLFLILCVAVGVQSCNSSKKDNSNKNMQRHDITCVADFDYYNYHSYYLNYNSGTGYYNTAQLDKKLLPNQNYNWQSSTLSTLYINYNLSANGLDGYLVNLGENNNDGQPIKVRLVQFILAQNNTGDSNNPYGYRLQVIKFVCYPDAYNSSEWGVDICNKVNYSYGNNEYYFYTWHNYDYFYVVPFLSDEPLKDTNDIKINNLFTESQAVIFKFHENLLWNSGIDNFTDDVGVVNTSISAESNHLYRYTITTGGFVSNGYVYNQIRLTYFNPTANTTYMHDTDDLGNWYSSRIDKSNYFIFAYMEYGNVTNTNNWVKVAERSNYYQYYGGDTAYLTYDKEVKWLNDNYQYIYVFSLDQTNYDKIVLLNNGADTSAIGNLGGLTSVFTLLSGAFLQVFGFLSIQIYGGLTLGTLMFLPFVVFIIILVFRMVKK